MARNLRSSVIVGAAAGLAGALAMSEFQGWWSRAVSGDDRPSSAGDHDARGWQERNEDRNANELLAQRIAASTVHRTLQRRELAIAAATLHYGFGAALGAAFGAMAGRVRLVPGATGAAFGAAVWIAADEVAVPALNLSDPDAGYPADAHLQSFASHIVFGVTTELAYLGMSLPLRQR
jgi:uncharacterized membrane protein YagU involved in acid resistance